MRQPILPIALLLSLITTALANSGGTILFCAELDLVGPCIVQPIEYGRCDNITDSNRLGDIGSSFNVRYTPLPSLPSFLSPFFSPHEPHLLYSTITNIPNPNRTDNIRQRKHLVRYVGRPPLQSQRPSLVLRPVEWVLGAAYAAEWPTSYLPIL